MSFSSQWKASGNIPCLPGLLISREQTCRRILPLQALEEVRNGGRRKKVLPCFYCWASLQYPIAGQSRCLAMVPKVLFILLSLSNYLYFHPIISGPYRY